VACIEEIALLMGYITTDDALRIARSMSSTSYGKYLQRVIEQDTWRSDS
jgi:dTDP-glucose pyrophosphorylase